MSFSFAYLWSISNKCRNLLAHIFWGNSVLYNSDDDDEKQMELEKPELLAPRELSEKEKQRLNELLEKSECVTIKTHRFQFLNRLVAHGLMYGETL